MEKTTARTLFIAFIASLGGFLFGYDTAVISGTVGFVKTQFGMDTVAEGWFVSSALWGCIFGVAITGFISDAFGRKKALLASGILFSVSALGCAFAGTQQTLIFYRLLGGIGVGVASMLSPLYISEVSPAHTRGKMVSLYQFAITIGILCAYFANSLLLNNASKLSFDSTWLQKIFVDEVWRGMFGSEAIPALMFFFALFLIPASPRWLLSKKKTTQAKVILNKLHGPEEASREYTSITNSLAKEETKNSNKLFSGRLKIALWAGMGLAILSQFTGINAIIYYGPKIMEEAGLQISDALGGQVIIGIVNVLATIYAIFTIDTFGRKKLMLGGITGMFISLLVVGVLFFVGKSSGILVLAFILIFIASFAIGYGPVIWVLLAEMYPTKIRGRAMSIATLTLWLGTAIIGQIVPWMLENLTAAGTFLIFALCCIPVPFILRLIPETKGKSLEEIEQMWTA